MKSLTCLCLFLLHSFLYSNFVCWAQEGDAVDFDFLYGRITGGLNFDGWGVFSDSEPIWEGEAGWGKKGLFSLYLKDRHKKYYNETFELPTVSGRLSLKSNWRASLESFDFYEMKYRDEGNIFDRPYGEFNILKHRSRSYELLLGTAYLSQDGKVFVPTRLLNFSYYQGIFLNKGQIALRGNGYHKWYEYQYKTFRSYYSGARARTNTDHHYRYIRLNMSAVYGIYDNWNIDISGTYGYLYSRGSSSTYAPDTGLVDPYYYYPQTSRDNIKDDRNEGELGVTLKGLISSRFLCKVSYNFEYTESKRRAERIRSNQPRQSSKSTDEHFTHFISMKWIYLSSNPNLSVKRILDDYFDYYGHLLNKGQIKCQLDLSFEGQEYIWKRQITSPPNRKFLNLTSESKLTYGLTERVNMVSSVHLDKRIRGYTGSRFDHAMQLYYDFGVILYTYSYDKHYRENISWESVSDFDYLFGPLLSKGQSQFEILISPRGFSKSWRSSSGNLLQIEKLTFMKYGTWWIKPRFKSGVTDFFQVSFESLFDIRSYRESISSTTRFNFQLWSNCRLSLSYYHQSETYMGYLYSLYGLTSSTYSITLRLNLLI